MSNTACPSCGYQGTGHYVGCDRPRTPAELEERRALEARIAAAYAADALAATLPGTRLEVEWWNAEFSAREARRMTYGPLNTWNALEILSQLAHVDDLTRERLAGHAWHVGGGLWLTICGHCDAYSITHGHMPTYATIGPHMVAEHDARVGGINVGLLS